MKRIILIFTIVAIAITAYGNGSVLDGIDLTDTDGKTVVQSDIATPLTLLYLNDPECDICHEVSDSLATSVIIQKAIDDRQLTLLSVYPGDNIKLWKAAATHKEWIECINPSMSIFESGKISFSYLPALFILDKDGNLLLNNPTVKSTESYLKTKL